MKNISEYDMIVIHLHDIESENTRLAHKAEILLLGARLPTHYAIL